MEPIETLLLELKKDSGNGRRPSVTLSYAQSLDGSIAVQRDAPLAISGSDSLRVTHLLRAEHDAILVGVGTVLADDPQLTVRMAAGKDPRPVILDSRLRTPPTATVLSNGGPPPLLVTTPEADESAAQALTGRGAQVLRLPANPGGGISLPALLPALSEQGIRRLMVEGGARIITAFLTQQLVDRLVVTIAPLFIGGVRALEQPLSAEDARRAFPSLQNPKFAQAGADLILWGELRWGRE